MAEPARKKRDQFDIYTKQVKITGMMDPKISDLFSANHDLLLSEKDINHSKNSIDTPQGSLDGHSIRKSSSEINDEPAYKKRRESLDSDRTSTANSPSSDSYFCSTTTNPLSFEVITNHSSSDEDDDFLNSLDDAAFDEDLNHLLLDLKNHPPTPDSISYPSDETSDEELNMFLDEFISSIDHEEQSYAKEQGSTPTANSASHIQSTQSTGKRRIRTVSFDLSKNLSKEEKEFLSEKMDLIPTQEKAFRNSTNVDQAIKKIAEYATFTFLPEAIENHISENFNILKPHSDKHYDYEQRKVRSAIARGITREAYRYLAFLQPKESSKQRIPTAIDIAWNVINKIVSDIHHEGDAVPLKKSLHD